MITLVSTAGNIKEVILNLGIIKDEHYLKIRNVHVREHVIYVMNYCTLRDEN